LVSGAILSIRKSPRDLSILSFPIVRTAALGVTTRINYLQEVLGMARSVNFRNNDGANAATLVINNDTINSIPLPASGTFTLNDMWIEQVQVLAGAAGTVTVSAEVVPREALF
jgi:hypothetical protein